MTTQTIPSTLAWAKEHGTPFSWWTNEDNHEPTRGTLHGKGWYYTMPEDDPREDGIILHVRSIIEGRRFERATNAVYLIDNGNTVDVYYVAGWNDHGEDVVYLNRMPTDTNADGTPKMRVDGSPVDYSTWCLGPRRAYHLKVTQ